MVVGSAGGGIMEDVVVGCGFCVLWELLCASGKWLSPVCYAYSLLLGMAAIEALGYQRLDELGASKLRSIRSLGGGAENKPWTKMRLNILNVPEYSVLSTQAALGTARLAWRGLNHAN